MQSNLLNYVNFDLQFIKGLDDSLHQKLIDQYNIHKFDLEDIFTDTQLSKLEKRDKYLYIALQFPEYDKSLNQFLTKEIHCLLSKSYLIIIDKNNYADLQQFFNLSKKLIPLEADSYKTFFEVLDYLITKHVKSISKFRREISILEKNLFAFEDKPKDFIKQILIIKRNIINFQSLMVPLEIVLSEFQNKNEVKNNNYASESIDDSLDKIKKINNNLDNLKAQISLVSEANETILTRSTNDTIKALTGINIIVLVPSIITSFFGMNIYFGWDASAPRLFELIAIIVFCVFATILTFFYFKKKGWV